MFKAKLLTAIKFENSTRSTYNADFATQVVVKHCYGRFIEKVKVGEMVYVEQNESWTNEGIEHEYKIEGIEESQWTHYPNAIRDHKLTGATRPFKTIYAESWTVFFGNRGVVEMSTPAAKKYLKALRDEQGNVIEDDGDGKRLKDRYSDEMAR